MSSTDTPYSAQEQKIMLEIARESVAHGLRTGNPLIPNQDSYPKSLQADGASFVTLTIDNELRGCIGTLSAYQPLIKDVAQHAFAAAFEDPRFAPLKPAELQRIAISISVLSKPHAFPVESEEQLLSELRPGVDGLILTDGFHRATFLPSVWESLPQANDFLRHLKQKAGLPGDYWSDSIGFQRYTTFSFHESL